MITLLFDFDGTLADSIPSLVRLFNNLLHKYNYPQIPPEKIEEYRGENVLELFHRAKISLVKLPQMLPEFIAFVDTNSDHIKPFEEISHTLQALKEKGYRLGIISSNKEENIKKFLKANDIDLFDFIYSENSLHGKEKLINDCMMSHKLLKNETIYIGDEIRDIEAAHTAKIKSIAVTWGFNTKSSLLQADPECLAQSPNDILELVERII